MAQKSEKPGKREERRAALRMAVLAAARELLVTRGYDALTMRELADRVHYAPATLYLHFSDKADLIRQLLADDFRALNAWLYARLAGVADPVARLRGFAADYVEYARANPATYRLLFMTTGLPNPQDVPALGAPRRGDEAEDGYAFLVRTVADAVAATGSPADAETVAQMIWAALHGVIALRMAQPLDSWVPWADAEPQAREMVEILLARYFPGR